MHKEKNKKQALLDAFDQSLSKRAAEACKIAGVSLSVFYFHRYKDADFYRRVLEKQRDHLSNRIASV
jgi:hypothetical protein